ncbi:homolog to restriction system mrr [Haloferax gibbonsii]|uniref:Homolog to restriction system mrr n=1 Tax=Haloferax gibbonsii TaxID=35746 RepID=A0A871BD76_HALGI|nr:restriction endonuclease [Haloferax gibbonsii]QOS10958.1 homolog to restriction system mrr [Haloferax gibbonsii]
MTRLVELEPTKFVHFLSDLWTQRNWQTNAQPRGEGRYLVQGQRGDGTKGLMLVLPSVETTVGTGHVKGFVAHAKKRGIDTVVVATQGEFDDSVRGFATNHDVTLLDRDELGETVADEGLEQTVKQYTDGEVFETAEVEFGLPFDLPEPIEEALASLPIAAVRERLAGLTGDGDGGGGGGDDSSGGSLRDRLPSSVDDLKSGSPPSVRVVVVAVLLLVLALGSVAVLGPMVDGLGGSSAGGNGVAVSALSGASTDSADLVARWNARTADSLQVGNQTYAAPEGERFVVVGLNATAASGSPGNLPQSALVFESDGVSYGHQPLSNATGFDNGALFAPGESTHVWTVFAVPTNATTGTVLVQPTNEDTVAFVHDDTVSTDPSGDD